MSSQQLRYQKDERAKVGNLKEIKLVLSQYEIFRFLQGPPFP
jgi:hypothetical protein